MIINGDEVSSLKKFTSTIPMILARKLMNYGRTLFYLIFLPQKLIGTYDYTYRLIFAITNITMNVCIFLSYYLILGLMH